MRKYLFWILLIFGCKAVITPEQHVINDACLQLNDTIRKAWKYDSIQQHYIFSPNFGFLDELNRKNNKFRQCMESRDTAYIVKLLGKCSRIEKLTENNKYPNRLVYMLTTYPCLGNDLTYDCESLNVYFDSESKILFVEFYAIMGKGGVN